MSQVRTKKLRKLGLHTRNQIRNARKYILTFPKCNRLYGYSNYAFHLGKLDSFTMFQTPIGIKSAIDKSNYIAQIQKHLENGDIKFTRTPLFEPPKLIIGCDLAAEGTSDYSVPYLYKHQ